MPVNRFGCDGFDRFGGRSSVLELLPEQGLHRVSDFLASTIGCGDGKVHSLIVFCRGFGRAHGSERGRRQQFQSADGPDPNPLPMNLGCSSQLQQLALDRCENAGNLIRLAREIGL